jgi:hypothetical protein
MRVPCNLGLRWRLLAIVDTKSAERIRSKYPVLQVFESEPAMLDSAAIASIRKHGAHGISDAPAGWLADLIGY